MPSPAKEAAMLTQRLEESPKDRRGGQVSYLLLGPRGSVDSEHLAVTWVVGEPGSEQEPHLHEHSEQAYVIVRGRGLMRVSGETRQVTEGVLVLVPAGATHSILNVGDEPLVYVSATTPPFEVPAGRWER
jgi:mannose-6-phosphate isomerase-like protein (cupin superfamily)